jgi:predicted lipid-binding transport protein (Tim44 family)
MKTAIKVLIFAAALGMASMSVDAAKRFGGGGNLGKQRPAPTATAKDAAPAATPAQTAPAAGAAAAAAKPSFMQRWGGLLAGLGIGALLASMFGAQMGPIMGMLFMVLAIAAVGFMLFRLFASRNAIPASAAAPGATGPQPMRFQGIGSALTPGEKVELGTPPQPAAPAPNPIPGFEAEPFVRVAKTSFIRLQAANDARDLDDIRDFTTPEMYAEISMQIRERGDEPQKTEVVMVDARVVESVVEGDYAIASVRFTGLIRENDARNPEPFDEIWHVRKNLKERNASWLIAGIRQSELA